MGLYSRCVCTAVFWAGLGLSLAGCGLPYQQLTLPNAIDPSNGAVPASGAPKKQGVALSDPSAAATKESRFFDGNGIFVSNKPPAPIARASDAPSGSSVTKDGITINLVGASVPEVAKTVLGDVLGVNYSVSEKVKATITLSTVRPVDKQGLLEIFEAVLRAEGAAIVVEGGLHKIVPSADAGASGAPLRSMRTARDRAQGLSTFIVPLRYVSAPEMERILKSAAPQASVLRVDAARNMLLLSGTQTELSSMNEIIDVFDVDWMRGMSFGIFPVETSDPEAIAQELDTIFANDRDSPTKGIVRFIPNRRLKSILVISSRPEYLKKAAGWMDRIDLTSRATEKQVFVYRVQHRPASELSSLMQKVYGGKGGGGQRSSSSGSLDDSSRLSSDSSGSATGGASSFAAPAIQAPAQPGFSSTPQQNSTRPADSQAQADVPTSTSFDANKSGTGGALPPDDRSAGISVVADEPNNTLVITATASQYRRMRQMLQNVDVSPSQVLIEATIAEVSLNNDLKMGVRYFLNNGTGNNFTFTDDKGGLVASNFPGFSYFMNFSNMKIALDALSSVTDVNIISTPTLSVVENKKAVLQVGDEVPITTGTAVSTSTAGAPIVNSVSYRSTGVIMGITPRVSDDGRVVLDIEQEVSSVSATAASSTIDSPTIQQRRVKTTVTVNDGESMLLAGLVQDNSSRIRTQVPILGDLDFIGNAFKNKTDKIGRTELLIAITPHVIRDSHQIDQVMAEYRDRMNLTTRPQRKGPPDTREQIDRLLR